MMEMIYIVVNEPHNCLLVSSFVCVGWLDFTLHKAPSIPLDHSTMIFSALCSRELTPLLGSVHCSAQAYAISQTPVYVSMK